MGSIFLVGFMGCGKTTVGQRVAERRQLPFIDLDRQLELFFKRPIHEVFAVHGEPTFRRAESELLTQVADGPAAAVATGGGCFCSSQNRRLIASSGGTSVFLQLPWQVIRQRLPGSNSDRPLLKDPAAAYELFCRRQSDYRKATFTINLSGQETVDQVADAVLQRLAEVVCVS